MTTNPVEEWACPCGAQAGKPCLTNQGHPRDPHPARVRAYEAVVALWS